MIKVCCVSCFKALSVPVRAQIYEVLSNGGPLSVGDIVKKFKLTQPTISYHLKDMEKAGLLSSRKEGKKTIYEINTICPNDRDLCLLL